MLNTTLISIILLFNLNGVVNDTTQNTIAKWENYLKADDWEKWTEAIIELSKTIDPNNSPEIIDIMVSWFIQWGDSLQEIRNNMPSTKDNLSKITKIYSTIDIISKLKDPRLIPVFSRMHNYKALLNYEDEGIEEILRLIPTQPDIIGQAIYYLGEAVRPKVNGFYVSLEMRGKIKSQLLNLFNNYSTTIHSAEHGDYRLDIIEALWKFPENDIPHILDSLGNNDMNLRQFVSVSLDRHRLLVEFLKDGFSEEEEGLLKELTRIYPLDISEVKLRERSKRYKGSFIGVMALMRIIENLNQRLISARIAGNQELETELRQKIKDEYRNIYTNYKENMLPKSIENSQIEKEIKEELKK